MFQKFFLSAALLSVAFIADLSVANAIPLLPYNATVDPQVIDTSPAQYMGRNQSGFSLQWQIGRDGNRCRSRYRNCNHYYQGYYYETPWWTIPLIIGNQALRQNGGNAHVQWCMSRYRSYNPRTDLWLGNSGRRYRCNSPY
jgi:BA14K-like protein